MGKAFRKTYLLRTLTTPSCWVRVYGVGHVWDERLNRLLDKYPIKDLTSQTIKLGDTEVWVANYPYGFGNIWDCGIKCADVRELPKRGTVFRLKDALVKHLKETNAN